MRVRVPLDLSTLDGATVYPTGRSAHVDVSARDLYAGVYSTTLVKSDAQVAETRVIVVDASLNAVTVTLPSPNNETLPVTVIAADATNNVTVVSKAGASVGGASSQVLDTDGTAITLVPCKGQWYVAGRA